MFALNRTEPNPKHAMAKVNAVSSPFNRWAPCLMLMILLAVYFIATVPRFPLGGDNFTARSEAIHLLNTGQLGIPFSRAQELGGQINVRGQFFFENRERQRYFPKYGIGYTFAYTVALLPMSWKQGSIPLFDASEELMFYLNTQNTCLAIIAMFYLYGIVAFYTKSHLLRSAFVLASVFGTFLRFYLRVPAFEIFQIPFFLGAAYHFLAFMRRRERQENSAWLHLALSSCCIGFLCLLKISFLALFGPVWLMALLPVQWRGNVVRNTCAGIRSNWKAYLGTLVIPFIVFAAVLALSNWYRFGGAITTGYGQWDRPGTPLSSPSYIMRNFRAYFVPPGRYNVFVHYPLFLFALPAFWLFCKRHGKEALFVVLFFLAHFAPLMVIRSLGAYCYAPRYTLPALVLGSVPVIELWKYRKVGARTMKSMALLAINTLMLVTLIVSARMQFSMNSLNWLTYYSVRDPVRHLLAQFADNSSLNSTAVTQAQSEFSNYMRPFHEATIIQDLIRFRDHGTPFPLVEPIVHCLPPAARQERETLQSQLEAYFISIAEPNYLLLN